MLKLKLIAENPDVFDNFEVIEEQSNRNSASNLYVKGPFIGCNVVNKNSRMYKLDDTRTEVQRYVNEMVMPGRAMGELNHPSSADVNLERACHLVTELAENDDYFIGKAKVLSTPTGQILRSLINDGVKIGMSTRALGQLSENIYKYWVVYPHINSLIQNTGVEMKDLKISDMIDIPLQIVIP